MHSKLLLSQVFILFLSLSSYSQTWEWTKQYGSTAPEFCTGITSDENNNYYTSGRPNGCGNVTQYNSYGDTTWNATIGSELRDISYDHCGNLYVIGFQIGQLVLSKIDTSGNTIWTVLGNHYSIGHSLAADCNSIFITGQFDDTLSFDDDTLISPGVRNCFVAKFDETGNCIWLKPGGTSATANSLCTDLSGNIILTGLFKGMCNFNGTLLTSSGYSDIFVSKYDPNGNLIWVQKAGGQNPWGSYNRDNGCSVTTNSSDEIFVTGSCNDTAIFGTIILPDPNLKDDIFLAKYAPDGTLHWVKRFGESDDDEGRAIALDLAGNIYVGGSHMGPISFDSVNLPAYGDCDVFLTKFDPNGNAIFGISAGNFFMDDFVKDLLIDSNNDIVFTGFFHFDAYFGDDTLISEGSSDNYIAKLSNPLASISEKDISENVNIYPNPSSGIFTIEINTKGKEETEIEVYSVTGQLIKTQIENSDKFQIDISEMNKGMYLLKVQNKNSITSKRIIKH